MQLVITTVFLCTLVSLFIELSQVFIAERRSNLHDVVLNGVGGFIGVVTFQLVLQISRYFTRPSE